MKKLFILGLMMSLFAFSSFSGNEAKAAKAANSNTTYEKGSSFTFFAGAEQGILEENTDIIHYLALDLGPYLDEINPDHSIFCIKTLKLTNDPNDLPASDMILGGAPIELGGCTYTDGNGNTSDTSLLVYLSDRGIISADNSPWYDCVLYANAETIYAHPYSFALFADLSNVVEMDLSLLNTSKVVDMSFMFSGCWSLNKLNISGWDTSNVGDMSNMFAGSFSNSMALDNEYITTLDISHFDTSKVGTLIRYYEVWGKQEESVGSMERMFDGCARLSSIKLGAKFNTSNVTTMESMFYQCEALRSIDVSNFDTSKVTNMDAMFDYCLALESIDVSNFNTSKVTNMNDMFYYCSKLKRLDISSFEMKQVTSDLNRFMLGCDALEYIKTPKSLPASSSTDAKKAIQLPTQFTKVYNIETLTAANLAQYPVLTLVSEVAEKFINDWRALRTRGGAKGICAALVQGSEENAILIQLLGQYDSFDAATQSSIDAAEDTTGVTIGETIIYVKAYMAKNQSAEKAALGSYMNLSVEDNSAYLIAIISFTGALSIAGYYLYNKRKHAM